MARQPRLSLPSYPHHVIQRGNNRQPIFLAAKDYAVFLECLREAKRKCHARLYAYVLMTNHVHLLAEPEHEGDLRRFMQSVGRRYVRYINDTYERTGTLWEGRFKGAIVNRDEYLIMCSRHIELNPVRAGIVRHPREYRWSSYHGRAMGRPDPLLDEDPWYVTLGDSPQARAEVYAKWRETSVSDNEWDRIRKATQQGRVVESDVFQEETGGRVGRRLVGETRGRPKEVANSEIVL